MDRRISDDQLIRGGSATFHRSEGRASRASLCKLKRLHGFTYFNRSADARGCGAAGKTREKVEGRGERPVATRKPRAKRFVECFMESFRIVDFLSHQHRSDAGSARFMAAAPRAGEAVRAATSSGHGG